MMTLGLATALGEVQCGGGVIYDQGGVEALLPRVGEGGTDPEAGIRVIAAERPA